MAKTNLGRVGMVLKGDYDSTATYRYLDVVSEKGVAYAAKKESQGVAPPNEEYWQTLTGVVTAADSNKLGGKAPEYYLPAVQLLGNPDFALAQAGYGGLHGGTRYAADRWPFTGTISSINVNRGVMTISAKNAWERMDQIVPLDRLKTGSYTFAIKIRNGVLEPRVYINGTQVAGRSYGAQSEWVTAVLNFEINDISTVNTFAIRLYFTNTNTVEICEPMLYPGTYTAETLPSYVQTHPQIENLKIGNPVQPVQLLGNPDFALAQAGYGGMHVAVPYAADRWKNSGNLAVSKNNNGGIIVSHNGDKYKSIDQVITGLRPGTVYTFALKSSGSTARRIGFFSENLLQTYSSATGTEELLVGTFTAPDANSVVMLIQPAFVDGGGTATLYWAALYEGAYTAETLPPFISPDPTLELIKCKQYYRQSFEGSNTKDTSGVVTVPAISTGNLQRIVFDTPMRETDVVPTVKIYSYITGAESAITDWMADSDVTNVATNVQFTDNKGFMVRKNDNSLTPGKIYAFNYSVSLEP